MYTLHGSIDVAVYSPRFLRVERICKSVNATWSLRVSYVSKLFLGKYVIKVSHGLLAGVR